MTGAVILTAVLLLLTHFLAYLLGDKHGADRFQADLDELSRGWDRIQAEVDKLKTEGR